MRKLPLASAFFFAACLSISVAQAASSPVRDFIVPVDDGYGMDDCMAEGGACAKLIADSWCQVNGMKKSLRFVAADVTDITASLSKKIQDRVPTPSYIVTCTD
jgi:hypothetical protein